MSVLIRVDDVPPRERLEYFRHVVADTFVPFDVHIESERDLRAQIATEHVGAVQVSTVSAPSLGAFRTSKHIRASDPELFKLEVPTRGTVIAQGGREAALSAGDSTLLDLSRPCQLVDRGDAHGMVAVKFPHDVLPLRHDEVSRLTATPISGRSGLGATISSLASHMAGQHNYSPTEGTRLATALIDLLIVALAERLDRMATLAPATRQRAQLASVQAFIDRRLADPGLSPSVIAAAHHMSLRALYRLFESQQASVAGWIRQRRLERCRRDLADPALVELSVSAIGARWGFVNPSYFSRAFRAAYGLPPAEYRRATGTASVR
jgi:AraC-like DNA-binding protein